MLTASKILIENVDFSITATCIFYLNSPINYTSSLT